MTGRRVAAALLATVLCAQPALAASPSYCPRVKGGTVDPAKDIDKNEFATAMVDSAGIPIVLAGRVLASATPPGLSPFETLLALGPSTCALADAGGDVPAGKIKCSQAEIDTLTKAQNDTTIALSKMTVTGAGPGPVDAPNFFSTPGMSARCVAPANELVTKTPDDPATPQSRDRWAITNFRVRGTPADIIYEHGSPGFGDADPAKLTIGSDDGKWSKSVVGTIGYAIPLVSRQNPVSLKYTDTSLVPFFGVDLEESRKKGLPKDVDSNTISFGMALQFERTYPVKRPDKPGGVDSASWYLGVIPKAVFNYKDKSRIAGLNLLWRPEGTLVLAPGLELPFNANAGMGKAPFLWHFIFDTRWNNGTFLRQGTRSFDESRDFSRFGMRGGITFLTYGTFKVPIELTVTDTYMFLTLAGKPGQLSEFKTDATIYFTDDKIFGLELSYARGRIEDLDSRDNKWSLALTAKY